jgi:hypothetical protein
MIKMMWGDQEVEVKNLEYTIDKEMTDDVPAGLDLALAQHAEMTVTLKMEYYKVMYLAAMMDKHSPKKAKALRRRFEYLNPLRLLGLL